MYVAVGGAQLGGIPRKEVDMDIRPCPECGYRILIQQIDFKTMTFFLYCPKCGYKEKGL